MDKVEEHVIAVTDETFDERVLRAEGEGAGQYAPELLEALACEIIARPPGAPHFGDLTQWVRDVARTPGALLVEYDGVAVQTLERVVEAERLCCAGIGWEIEPVTDAGDEPVRVRLRVEADEDQLDTLATLFPVPSGETARAGSPDARLTEDGA